MTRWLIACCIFVGAAFMAACGGGSAAPTAVPSPTVTSLSGTATRTVPAGQLTLTSAAFADGSTIPADFTCDGPGASPPLAWTGVPTNAKALALVLQDPDAAGGGYVHWIVYAIPPAMSSLAAGISPKPGVLPAGPIEGVNGSGKIGYTGPCPPAGQQHHYTFQLFALDAALSLPPGRTAADVEAAVAGHILAQATLIGLYKRQ
jgi:Raf kinase inhibitor-like YbhB/YbcL family protein